VGAAAAFWATAGEMPATIEVAAPALNNWMYCRRVSTCILNKRAGKSHLIDQPIIIRGRPGS